MKKKIPAKQQTTQDNRRPDGTIKGVTGWQGRKKTPDGSVMTEFSVGVPVQTPNGEIEADIPTLVPTLTPQETQYLTRNAHNPERNRGMWGQIVGKAQDWASQRLMAGKSPYMFDDPTRFLGIKAEPAQLSTNMVLRTK